MPTESNLLLEDCVRFEMVRVRFLSFLVRMGLVLSLPLFYYSGGQFEMDGIMLDPIDKQGGSRFMLNVKIQLEWINKMVVLGALSKFP